TVFVVVITDDHHRMAPRMGIGVFQAVDIPHIPCIKERIRAFHSENHGMTAGNTFLYGKYFIGGLIIEQSFIALNPVIFGLLEFFRSGVPVAFKAIIPKLGGPILAEQIQTVTDIGALIAATLQADLIVY